MSHRSQVCNLYRAILRVHQSKLPFGHRALADMYVKKEFRDHKRASPNFVKGFMYGWNNYLEQLQQSPRLGRDLTEEEINFLSPEQRLQLEKLKQEATKPEKE